MIQGNIVKVEDPGAKDYEKNYYGMISRNLTSICDNAPFISSYAFYLFTGLQFASFTNASFMGYEAFAHCYDLISIDCRKCESILNGAFNQCSSLESVILNDSKILSIPRNAFNGCLALKSASYPNCINIGSTAFSRCSLLESIYFPNCEIIQERAFYNCINLSLASFPKCTSISASAFYSCSKLENAYFPDCINIDSNAFAFCYSLNSISIPNCKSINSYAFRDCSALSSVYLPECLFIASSGFHGCGNLSDVYLLGSNMCIIENSNAFEATYFYMGGRIHVPSSLYASYCNDPEWAYFSSNIVSG